MTKEEYSVKLKELVDAYKKGRTKDASHELFDFQYEYMHNVLEEYGKTVADDEAKQVCYNLLDYAVNNSTSGSSVEHVATKELADKVSKIIWAEIGKYLMDTPQIYPEFGEWAIDCMFNGESVPLWDGWEED